DVAQLVAHHLAKVRVAGSNPVVRSRFASTGLRSRVGRKPRAIGAVGARFLDTEEVTGSNPVSPTSKQRLVIASSMTSRSCRADTTRTPTPGRPRQSGCDAGGSLRDSVPCLPRT